MQKEYEQIIRTPFVFRQVKPALWKAPLAGDFCFFKQYPSFQASTAAFIHSGIDIHSASNAALIHSGIDIHSATTAMLIYSAYVIRCLPRLLFVC